MSISRTLALLFLAILIACGGDTPSGKTKDQAAGQESATLPLLPESTRTALLNGCDYVDIIFYEHGLSMSQDERQSIRQSILMASGEPAAIVPGCRPMGRMSFMIQGQITAEADFYSDGECQYLLFFEGTEVKYGELLASHGVQFFQNITTQLKQMNQ